MSDTPRTDALFSDLDRYSKHGLVAAASALCKILERENDELRRGEFICKKCGLRKDGEGEYGDF